MRSERVGAGVRKRLIEHPDPAAVDKPHGQVEMGHHPDLCISWSEVSISITNHAAGGLTANDFELAGRIDAIA